MLAFSISIFLSALLLFIIQPLLAKTLLPLFGGSPAVWLSNLVFYQMTLLLGYAYAYFVTKLPRFSWQAILHVSLLALSLLVLPITPASELSALSWWQPLTVFAVLSSTLLIPVMALSATGPLLQYWYYQSYHSDFPYRYYALSNFGSLLGLFAFPLLLEPFFGLKAQLLWWSIGYGLFLITCSSCAVITFKKNHAMNVIVKPKSRILKKALLTWLLLTALSSALLLTTTQVMLQSIIGFPLLWVIPLALYLISYIIIFYQPRWYSRSVWVSLFLILSAFIFYLPTHHQLTLLVQIVAFALLLLCGCMICHGEIYLSKPDKDHLTFYYLMMALGSVIGGLFVNLVSPLIFNESWDFYGTILAIFLYVIAVPIFKAAKSGTLLYRSLLPLSLFVFVGLIALINLNFKKTHVDLIYTQRNFLGKFEVAERDKGGEYHLRMLRNGNILHGQQYMDPSFRNVATTYYNQKSGLGLAIDFLRYNNINTQNRLRIGAIGLGAGTIATLAYKGDYVRFYELDPDIEKVANKYFSFLAESPAQTEVIIDDGRLALTKEWEQHGSQNFDIIAVDAFNGDAIPFHLLTIEAFKVYLNHLKPNGILAFHISSRYVDLYPPLQALATELGLSAYVSNYSPKNERWISQSEWLLISRQPDIGLFLFNRGAINFRFARMTDIWTDDYNYLLPIMRW